MCIRDRVNELGESLTNIAAGAQIDSIKAQIGSLDLAIQQLNADKQTWQERNEAAAASQAALIEDTKIYDPKITSAVIGKNWQGLVLQGEVSLTSPHADPINDFRNAFKIEHNGHSASFNNVRGQLTRYRKTSRFNLNLSPSSFINEAGESLPKDYAMPSEISAYTYSFRPVWVRTSGPKEGWKEYEYKLSQEQTTALYDLPTVLKVCDRNIESAQNLRTTYEEQIKILENKKFDDLRNVSGRYKENCI